MKKKCKNKIFFDLNAEQDDWLNGGHDIQDEIWTIGGYRVPVCKSCGKVWMLKGRFGCTLMKVVD